MNYILTNWEICDRKDSVISSILTKGGSGRIYGSINSMDGTWIDVSEIKSIIDNGDFKIIIKNNGRSYGLFKNDNSKRSDEMFPNYFKQLSLDGVIIKSLKLKDDEQQEITSLKNQIKCLTETIKIMSQN